MNVYHETQLPWPPQKPWTQSRKPGKFQSNIPDSIQRVETQVAMFSPGNEWRTKELWIYLDGGQLGAKGRFLANKYPLSPAVVVTFDLDDVPYTIAVDAYQTADQNLCAIAATIEGLRANERHGVLTMREMLQTFEALPQRSTAKRKGWWEVLGINKDSSIESIEAQYRTLLKSRHPDAGGTQQEFMDLQEAITTAREVKR